MVLGDVVKTFDSSGADYVFGDIVLTAEDELEDARRHLSGAGFGIEWFAQGRMPPHPASFVKRSLFARYGGFSLRYSIAADMELCFRFIKSSGASYAYLPRTLARMRLGGVSTRGGFARTLILHREVWRAMRQHKIRPDASFYLRLVVLKMGRMLCGQSVSSVS